MSLRMKSHVNMTSIETHPQATNSWCVCFKLLKLMRNTNSQRNRLASRLRTTDLSLDPQKDSSGAAGISFMQHSDVFKQEMHGLKC